MARRIETRPMREPLPTVIGAGITEKWYFRHLKSLCGYKMEVKPNKHFGNSDRVIEVLKHYIPYEKREKFLENSSWVKQLLADERMQKAMDNARELGDSGESYTNLPKAIIFLSEA